MGEVFEYRQIDWNGWMETSLNEMGAEGWEVVAVVAPYEDDHPNPEVILKRRRS